MAAQEPNIAELENLFESRHESLRNNVFQDVNRPLATILRNLGPADQINFGVAALDADAREFVSELHSQDPELKKHCKLLDDFKAAMRAGEKKRDEAIQLMLALLREPKERHFLKRGPFFFGTYGDRKVLDDVTALELKYHDTIGELVQAIIPEYWYENREQVHELAEAICTNITDNITASLPKYGHDTLPDGEFQVFQSALLPAIPNSHWGPPLSFNSFVLRFKHLQGWPMLLTYDNGMRELYFRESRNITLIGDVVFRQEDAETQWYYCPTPRYKPEDRSLPNKLVWSLLMIWDDRNVDWTRRPVNVDKSVHLRAPFTDVCLE